MIGNTESLMEQLTERITTWAASREDVRAVIVAGSRARATDRPADEFSDLDLLLITDDPAHYTLTTEWIQELGTPVVTFLEPTIIGTRERRVLFSGGEDVDFNFFPASRWRLLNRYIGLKLHAPWLLSLLPGKIRREVDKAVAVAGDVVRRGYRVLVDKEGLTRRIPAVIPAKVEKALPSEEEALNSIGDFWYHALWAARKLRRGELVVAKHCVDGRLKKFLYDAVETLALATHGLEYDTWHDWRFLEQWADPATVADLPQLYAHYDPDDISRALLATMSVFGRVAQEAMSRMGYTYPQAMEEQVTQMVRECLGQGASPQ